MQTNAPPQLKDQQDKREYQDSAETGIEITTDLELVQLVVL